MDIDPDWLGTTVTIIEEDKTEIDGIFDFFAQYVRRVHSDEFIRKALKTTPGTSLMDIFWPNDIAYVIALFKNSKEMWDQDIRMQESGTKTTGISAEKKLRPLFTSWGGQKQTQGMSLWNKDGMRYFLKAEVEWKEIFNSEDDMKIIYNRWEKWITTTGKRITVGDGKMKTFHAVMATWYEETPQSKKRNESEDEEGFGLEGWYSLERGRSRHSLAWRKGILRDKTLGGGEQGDSDSEQYHECNGVDGEDGEDYY